MNLSSFSWTRHPKSFTVDENGVDVVTAPHTDLWQRTYYHFRNDNAPVFQMETAEPYFSFVVNIWAALSPTAAIPTGRRRSFPPP